MGKGHKMIKEVSNKRFCDVTGKRGTHYTCSGGSNYDMNLESYKAAKKKLKADLEAWYKKNPKEKKKDEEEKKKKKDKKDDSDDDDDVTKTSENEKSEGETEKSDATKTSENEKSE